MEKSESTMVKRNTGLGRRSRKKVKELCGKRRSIGEDGSFKGIRKVVHLDTRLTHTEEGVLITILGLGVPIP